MNQTSTHLPALTGGLLALMAGTLFSIGMPLVQRAGAGISTLPAAIQPLAERSPSTSASAAPIGGAKAAPAGQGTANPIVPGG